MAGVDDAGRGCVIGPLVVAGVLMPEDKLKLLEQIGVRDSKELTPKRRERLAEEIRKIAEKIKVVKVPPSEVDRIVFRGVKYRRLNWLEAKVMAQVISELKPEIAYVDASDVLEERFKEQILEEIPAGIEVVSEHDADAKYPIVSAASIIAKTERDKEIQKLRMKYGDFGSGYPSDPKTREFLLKCLRERGKYPDCVRKSWKTLRRLAEERQETLF
ncbi:ribonuclease HII [Candidatus Bathyarchaeota archaeon]|nr:MAG: ribonuclease HII [Thermoplasmata archaeon]RLI30664.1 MAG: ribonuclease HII [Candidatus Bathyarchaeota archaeon]